MAGQYCTRLVFKVHRQDPILIKPSKPTPHEFKPLSDIDDQDGLRVQIPVIHFYPYNNNNNINYDDDPGQVMKDAIAKALVFYYPLAGRLIEGPNRKLIVECSGEGVMFIEADAPEVSLEGFGELGPPFPCIEELLFDVPGSHGMINTPLLLFQMTRLKCGGIVLAIRLNHAVSDAAGLMQFMLAIRDIAHRAESPRIKPVWERHLLNARFPPRVTCKLHEYDQLVDTKEKLPASKMTHRSFFFGPNQVSAIRSLTPLDLRQCSTFEILTAFMWRHRTVALQLDPNEEVRIICIVNARNKFNPPLPSGYYGNCTAYSVAKTTAGELTGTPLGYALKLVREAKGNVTEEYMRSIADLMVTKGRPWYTMVGSYLVSDVTRAKFLEMDFGWGKPIFGGPAKGNVASFHVKHTNKKGESGVLVTLCISAPAMERLVKELDGLLKGNSSGDGAIKQPKSAL
ncbi:hypothetical protein Tsubulata_000216 [Turnera subulata]|uniref:Uncharacterized protein n=1 Tax=Turnera subulata TaxID=218843 RepID=A0A9Q0G0J2_9ROSI|nr:hypothetical protein Tsubulata_000216 [Turnera subulata]